MIRIADMTNVWENVISHLEELGYDRRLQILPNLYDYIDERCPAALVVSDTALDEAYDQGKEDAGHANYDVGYEAGVAWGYKDGKADGIEEGYERGYAEGSEAGYEEGFEKGHEIGSERGHAEGFDAGKADAGHGAYDVGYKIGYKHGWNDGFDEGVCK